MLKCNFKGCCNLGDPQEGFDFYVCAACFEELERYLQEPANRQWLAAYVQSGGDF